MKSANWAGYGLRSKEYVSASGEWTQPAVDCSSGKEADASFWVGLDGVKSHSVEQTGTTGHCLANRATAVYYAWYEMYPDPAREAALLVRAGDRFSALVHAVSADHFDLTIKNLTTGQSFTALGERTGVWPSSAEWVVEPAASCQSGCATTRLAQFGDTSFSNLAAETTDGPVAFATSTAQLLEFDLRSRKGAPLTDISALAGDPLSFDLQWLAAGRR